MIDAKRVLVALSVGLVVGAAPYVGVDASEPDDAIDVEITAAADVPMVRYGNGAFSFRAPVHWERLSGSEELTARLHFVAQLREVLDAPPDVPADSFESVLSFAAFRIPEVGGYLVAALLDMEAPAQQILDVLHVHARGKNDWGNSLYLAVEEVVRSRRFQIDDQPALLVDVAMTGGLGIAAQYFRVPSDLHRIAGLALLFPEADWMRFEPIVQEIRDSIRIGVSPEPRGAPVAGISSGDEAHWESVQARQAQARPADRRPRVPSDAERTVAMTAGEMASRLVVLALAYAIVFFLTVRLIYFAIIGAGRWFVPDIDLNAYREAADRDPWTLGLLKTERMIMLCAITSMALAGGLLALFVRM